MITYKQYMNKEFTHAQYYNEFLTDELQQVVVNYIGEAAIKNSLEDNFSDIPLISWDRLASTIESVCSLKLNAKGSPRTLSIYVCIAKMAARHIRGI